MIPIYEIELPEYSVEVEPNFNELGKKLDDEIKKRFKGKDIAIRAIGSMEHPDKNVDELIETITRDGTDRYDPERTGNLYDNVENKKIDFFALPVIKLSGKNQMFNHMLRSFYEWPLKNKGYPVKVDIITIYDLSKLIEVEHKYEGRDDIKRDGFRFKNQNNKSKAILAIYKIR